MKIEHLPYAEIKKKIEDATAVTILSHVNPDADALGTALGIYALLSRDKGKKIEVVNASMTLPINLDFLPNFKKIKHHMDYTNSLIICCDSGSLSRLGFDIKGRDILNIDHHASNTYYGSINVVLEEYASSSQVAFALFRDMYIVDAQSATCFYTALLSDTRYFTTSSVNEIVFTVANELLALGANITDITKNFIERRSLGSLRILAKSLSSLTMYNNAQIAILSVSMEDILSTGATVSDMEGIVDYAKSLVTVQIAVFVMELTDEIRVSLRSKDIDISSVAIAFGGGGHKLAAGFTLNQCGLQETIDTILEKIENLGLINE